MHAPALSFEDPIYTCGMNYYLDALQKYADFTGRASRKQYWMFVLINFIIVAVLWAICLVLHNLFLYWIYWLALIIPGISVGVRRLHDTDHRGWWYFLGLIPLVGAIVLLVFFVTDSQPGQNRFGANPKGM